MSSQKKSLPDASKLPTSHADLLKLRDDLRERSAAARKAKDHAAAKAIRALARKVRKLERATRKGAPKTAAKKAPKAAKKSSPKEEHTAMKKAA